jgi:hypothetical protein
MPPLLLLRRVIQGAVGERHVIGDPDVRARYETDWTGRFHGEAACVVRPGSADDVAGAGVTLGRLREHARGPAWPVSRRCSPTARASRACTRSTPGLC